MKSIVTQFYVLAGFANAWAPWGHGECCLDNHDQPIVSTTSGQVHGKMDPKLPKVRQFLGIPYAKPPVDELRWQAPELLLQPDTQIQVPELPPSCNQLFSATTSSPYTRDVLQFNIQGLNRTGRMSEDCLTVSIWTPVLHRRERPLLGRQRQQQGLPVLIYIYGGAFTSGGEDVSYQIPTQWVNRSPTHVVAYNSDGPDKAQAHRALLGIFACPGTETIRLRQKTGRQTHSYRYSGNFTNISPRPWMGAYHSSELPLIFGTHPNYRGPSTDLEYATSHAMQDAWVAFARDPLNGLAGQAWPVNNRLGVPKVREFGMEVPVREISIAGIEEQCDVPAD